MGKHRLFKKIKCSLWLFCLGGLIYNLIEVLWRGYTHWSMFFVGGTCFNIIGRIQTVCKRGIVHRCALCAVAITFVEYISGCLFNLRLKLNVWDYSRMRFNIRGQVCLLYSILWGALSLIAMPIYSRCRGRLEGGKKRTFLLH